ncbi:MAG: dihydropyrimidinase [Chloroflexi bacterium]|nr:dihydropyrimidinase [Chloroflexota bacterium]
MDLVIRNGTVVTADGVAHADVGIEGGVVVALGRGLPTGDREIDATGRYVFPGGIDAHTHLGRHRPIEGVDDFLSGTRAAAAGGITTVLDYVVHPRGTSLATQVARWSQQVEEQAIIDVGLHPVIGEPRPDVLDDLPALVQAGHTSFKFFMNRNFDSAIPEFLAALRRVGELGALACVHAEDESLIRHLTERLLAAGRGDVRAFPDSRPDYSEAVAVGRAVAYAQATETPIYLVHLSSRAALEVVDAARDRDLPVYAETRPIYLYLTRARFEEPEANKYVGYPPLREPGDQDALWGALRRGLVQVVATDHVGYTLAHKTAPGLTVATIPAGMANLETMLPMLYSEGVARGRLSLSRFVEMIATNPARMFGLFPRKGTIAVGSDADLVVFDPNRRVTVQAAAQQSQADFDVYEGWEVQGWPEVTISRGEVVFANGVVVGQPGRGRVLARQPFQGG